MADPDYRAAAERIAADLEGTCDSLEYALERRDFEGFDNVMAFCDRLDSLVFCCTSCDWWFGVGETGNDVNGQWACVECGGEIID